MRKKGHSVFWCLDLRLPSLQNCAYKIPSLLYLDIAAQIGLRNHEGSKEIENQGLLGLLGAHCLQFDGVELMGWAKEQHQWTYLSRALRKAGDPCDIGDGEMEMGAECLLKLV